MPYVRVSPVLAEYVRRILLSRDVSDRDKSSGNSFSYKVEGEQVVPLVHSDMGLCCTINDGVIVTRDMGLAVDRNTMASMGGPQFNGLSNTGSHGQVLAAASGNFSCGWLLGMPIHWWIGEEVHNSCNRATSDQTMHQVMNSIDHKLVQGHECLVRKDLLKVATD